MAKIQEQGKVGFKQAISDFWRGYGNFRGKSTRAGYWFAKLFNYLVIISLIILIPIILAISDGLATFLLFSLFIYFPVIFIPMQALKCRRLQDLGVSDKLSVNLISAYIVLYLLFIATRFLGYSNGILASILMLVLGSANMAMFILSLLPSNVFAKK